MLSNDEQILVTAMFKKIVKCSPLYHLSEQYQMIHLYGRLLLILDLSYSPILGYPENYKGLGFLVTSYGDHLESFSNPVW
jgi:hypothetical protein